LEKTQAAVMSKALGIINLAIATHLTRKAGYTKTMAQTGGCYPNTGFRGSTQSQHTFDVHGCSNVAGAWMRRSDPYAISGWGVYWRFRKVSTSYGQLFKRQHHFQ